MNSSHPHVRQLLLSEMESSLPENLLAQAAHQQVARRLIMSTRFFKQMFRNRPSQEPVRRQLDAAQIVQFLQTGDNPRKPRKNPLPPARKFWAKSLRLFAFKFG